MQSLRDQFRPWRHWIEGAELALWILLSISLLFFEQYLWGIVAAMAGLAGIHWLFYGRMLRRSPANWTLIILLFMIPVTIWVSVFPDLTRYHAVFLIAGVAIYAAVLNWTRTPDHLQWFLIGAVLAVAGLALLGPAMIDPERADTAFMPQAALIMGQRLPELANPNVISGALVVWLPVIFAVGYRPLGAGRRRSILRIMAFVAIIFMFITLLLLRTRGAWLALALGVLLAAGLRWPRLWALTPLVAVVLWMALGQGGMAQALSELLFADDPLGGLDARVEIWSRALLVLRGFPLTGSGIGTWEKVGPLLYPYVIVDITKPIPHAHNLLLQVGVDLGFPGLIAYVSLLGTSFWMAFVARKRFLLAGQAALATLALAVFVAESILALHGLVDAVTWGTKPALLAWALLALAAVLFLQSERIGREFDPGGETA